MKYGIFICDCCGGEAKWPQKPDGQPNFGSGYRGRLVPRTEAVLEPG